MKKIYCLSLLSLCFVNLNISGQELKLWYDKPAGEWVEALPLGNGHLGAMVFGGVGEELIQLNEGTLWSGGPVKKNPNPGAIQCLQPLRDALAQQDYESANLLAQKMQGPYTESFMPLGNLYIKQDLGGRDQTAYYRELRLDDAVTVTRFTVDGVKYEREVFVSNPDRIMAVRITADKPGMLDLDICLSSLLPHKVSPDGDRRIEMSGKTPSRVDPVYYNPGGGRYAILQDDPEGCGGMRFQTIIQAIPEGGSVATDESGIHISGADKVLLLVSAATSFNGYDKCPDSQGKDEKEIAEGFLSDALSRTYSELLSRHTDDFRKYFDRLSLRLADSTPDSKIRVLPSDKRLKLYSTGNHDPELETIYFQYGRYLLISCSRPGGSAANLQGIWNKELRPPWSSNYTININTEMNYWPSETANLSEMHEPMLAWINNLSRTGAETASSYYGTRGWVAHHNSDIWCLSNPVGMNTGDPLWANWYMGGTWLCQHLWEHYAFTGDKQYLREKAYPVMKEAALFCIDWMIEKDGYLTTSPSTSPENAFLHKGKTYSVTEGSTMDIALVRDLFTNLIQASEILDIDKEFRDELIEKREKLLPYKIGSQGQLLEWAQEYPESDPHHRHVSHLVGLHPGRDISPLRTPELANATRRTFEIRGDEGTGWSKGWKINFAARLLEGDHAYKLIRDIMTYVDGTGESSVGGGTYPNFFDAHPPFQIDGNFGATAGIIEMLVQSHLDEIHLLPALPGAWSSGEIKGVKARGNFEVGIKWKDNTLAAASIVSLLGNPCIIRTSTPIKVEGIEHECTKSGEYYLTEFLPEKGVRYILRAM